VPPEEITLKGEAEVEAGVATNMAVEEVDEAVVDGEDIVINLIITIDLVTTTITMGVGVEGMHVQEIDSVLGR
jgi:hypothetical protein